MVNAQPRFVALTTVLKNVGYFFEPVLHFRVRGATLLQREPFEISAGFLYVRTYWLSTLLLLLLLHPAELSDSRTAHTFAKNKNTELP